MAEQRFAMKLDPWWRPMLLVGAATPDNSYLEITDEGVVARFGAFFNRTIPRDQIESAGESEWPIWLGVGWRAGFGGRCGLIGSYNGIVELQLAEPMQVLRVFSFTSLSVSLEDPRAFLEALAATSAAAAPADRAPPGNGTGAAPPDSAPGTEAEEEDSP